MNTAEINLPLYDYTQLLGWDATEFYWWLADTVDKYTGVCPFESVNAALMGYNKHCSRIASRYGALIEDFPNSPMGRKHIAYKRKYRKYLLLNSNFFRKNVLVYPNK